MTHPPSLDGERRPCPYCGEQIPSQARTCPYCDEDIHAEGDDRPWEKQGRYGVRRDWEPHRGTLILVLGIISLVCTGLFVCYGLFSIAGLPLGIVAWVMGQRDLKKMKTNVMDPEGRGLTQGGWICGIIGTCLNALVILGWVLLFTVIIVAINQAKPPPRPVAPPPQAPKKKQAFDVPRRLVDYLPPSNRSRLSALEREQPIA